MTTKKYLMLTAVSSSSQVLRSCEAECPEYEGFKLFFNRCVRFRLNRSDPNRLPQSILDEIWQDLESCHLDLCLLCLLALFCSLLMLVFLWCAPRLVIWTALVGTVLTCSIGTFWLWCRWTLERESDHYSGNYLWYAVGASVTSAVIFLLVFLLWRKITLVIELLYEAGNAIRKMLFLLVVPVLTVATLTMSFVVAVYFILIIESAGKPVLVAKSVVYEKDNLVLVTRWYNIFAIVWFCQFLFDCQRMVTAGSITAWYFTVDKSRLGNAEKRSFVLLLRYHLGTVALGSFLIATTRLIRLGLKIAWCMRRLSSRARCCSVCCLFCLNCCVSWLDPIQRSAYIVTALQGQPFCRAGKAKLFVLVLVGFVGVDWMQQKRELYHPYVVLILVGVTVYLIAHCFLTMYEMAIDTIFLCFCKDIELNNGIDRPYYMSRNLRKFVNNKAEINTLRENKAGTSQQP
ncbi:choline transporter-like protein 1 [Topomyia yanbarensis]|uniref:choline transporter-like protein 1 n=1 Tax=Topomyia yanbarensis TaxID=2498891 RepID=UPI00273CBA6E|nr:choline transporter-like protein 1 [Topomyia yanbarensis]